MRLNRVQLESLAIHILVLMILIGPSLFRHNAPVLWIDNFDMMPGEGGGGGGGGGGAKQKDLGQVVPNPVKIPLPAKAAPIQKEIKAEEAWKVKDTKPQPKKEEPKKTVMENPDVERGEKEQKATSNIIRRGKSDSEKTGEGGFDFGEGSGSGGGQGSGNGTGIGIGFGPGSGGGFGFGSYLKLLRQRIWQEWTQSAVFGSNLSCVVGLNVDSGGAVSQIKLEKSSGNSFYDQVALRAVRNSNPLPPLPSNFPTKDQRFRIQFKLQE